ncbi:hypothetical protein FRX31_025841 [Thalictrum thalictroides]|uniref:Uncharacterized protein n=1 Tax=Thalictrum thalictroides TaxID=46969 RepID=A0A7J6VJT7_THATH|nr:hypothetical protein FRX31_025841 [Thalictrum thalictroides]
MRATPPPCQNSESRISTNVEVSTIHTIDAAQKDNGRRHGRWTHSVNHTEYKLGRYGFPCESEYQQMAEPVGQKDATSNSQQQPNTHLHVMIVKVLQKILLPQSGGVYKDEGGLETVDKAIADFEEDEDCGDIIQPKDTNKSDPILDVWDLDEDE